MPAIHQVVVLLFLALAQSALGSILWRRSASKPIVAAGSPDGLFARGAAVETTRHGLLAPRRPVRRSDFRTHPPTFNATQCQSVFHSHSGSTVLFPNADIFREATGQRRCGALVSWRNVHDVKFKLQWMQVEGQLGNHSTLDDVRVRGGFSLNNQQMIPLALTGSQDQGMVDEVGFGQRFTRYMLVGQDGLMDNDNDAPDAPVDDVRNSPCVRNESDVLSLFLELDIQWSYNATLADGTGFGGFKHKRHDHHGDHHGPDLDDGRGDDLSFSPLTIRFGGSAMSCDGGRPAFEFKNPLPDVDLDGSGDDTLSDVPSSAPTDYSASASSLSDASAATTTAAATMAMNNSTIMATSPSLTETSSSSGLRVPVSSWSTLSATNSSSTTSYAPTLSSPATPSSSSSKLQ